MLALARRLPFGRVTHFIMASIVQLTAAKAVIAAMLSLPFAHRRSGDLDRLSSHLLRDIGLAGTHVDQPDQLATRTRDRLGGVW